MKLNHYYFFFSLFRYKIICPGNHELTLDKPFYEKNWKAWHKEPQNLQQIDELLSSFIVMTNGFVKIENLNIYAVNK